jgi:hypothetical protein
VHQGVFNFVRCLRFDCNPGRSWASSRHTYNLRPLLQTSTMSTSLQLSRTRLCPSLSRNRGSWFISVSAGPYHVYMSLLMSNVSQGRGLLVWSLLSLIYQLLKRCSLSLWYPRHVLQLRIGLFYSAASLAGAFSGLSILSDNLGPGCRSRRPFWPRCTFFVGGSPRIGGHAPFWLL